MDVSTAEPGGKWKRWVKWLRLTVVLLAGIWLVKLSHHNAAVWLAWIAAVVVLMYRFRITEQRFDLLVDRQPVQVNLYTDASRRTWIKWKSQRTAILSCIREPYSTGWVDHEIALDGKQYRLRILVKPIGDGYMISNHGRGFEMVVLRHTYCS
jgi:hypothetical protein